MGSKHGVILRAAKLAGLTLEAYEAKIAAGLKRCSQCKQWRPITNYTSDKSRGDGKKTKCQDCLLVKNPRTTKGRVSTFKGHKHTPESLAKMSDNKKGNKNRLGKKHTEETRKRISDATRERTARGEHHYNFKHGKAQRNFSDRRKIEYQDWRNAVFARDAYTCQKCGDSSGGNLCAHHVKPFAKHPELRFDISNGITLCTICHDLEHYKPESIRNQRKLKRGEKLWK